MIRSGAVAFLMLASAGVACSDSVESASKEYCDLAVRATNGELNFADETQYASLVNSPGLPRRFREAMTAAAENARVRTAGPNGWANDDMVEVVNKMCGLKLTPVSIVP
jgi:hypothetical protein